MKKKLTVSSLGIMMASVLAIISAENALGSSSSTVSEQVFNQKFKEYVDQGGVISSFLFHAPKGCKKERAKEYLKKEYNRHRQYAKKAEDLHGFMPSDIILASRQLNQDYIRATKYRMMILNILSDLLNNLQYVKGNTELNENEDEESEEGEKGENKRNSRKARRGRKEDDDEWSGNNNNNNNNNNNSSSSSSSSAYSRSNCNNQGVDKRRIELKDLEQLQKAIGDLQNSELDSLDFMDAIKDFLGKSRSTTTPSSAASTDEIEKLTTIQNILNKCISNNNREATPAASVQSILTLIESYEKDNDIRAVDQDLEEEREKERKKSEDINSLSSSSPAPNSAPSSPNSTPSTPPPPFSSSGNSFTSSSSSSSFPFSSTTTTTTSSSSSSSLSSTPLHSSDALSTPRSSSSLLIGVSQKSTQKEKKKDQTPQYKVIELKKTQLYVVGHKPEPKKAKIVQLANPFDQIDSITSFKSRDVGALVLELEFIVALIESAFNEISEFITEKQQSAGEYLGKAQAYRQKAATCLEGASTGKNQEREQFDRSSSTYMTRQELEEQAKELKQEARKLEEKAKKAQDDANGTNKATAEKLINDGTQRKNNIKDELEEIKNVAKTAKDINAIKNDQDLKKHLTKFQVIAGRILGPTGILHNLYDNQYKEVLDRLLNKYPFWNDKGSSDTMLVKQVQEQVCQVAAETTINYMIQNLEDIMNNEEWYLLYSEGTTIDPNVKTAIDSAKKVLNDAIESKSPETAEQIYNELKNKVKTKLTIEDNVNSNKYELTALAAALKTDEKIEVASRARFFETTQSSNCRMSDLNERWQNRSSGLIGALLGKKSNNGLLYITTRQWLCLYHNNKNAAREHEYKKLGWPNDTTTKSGSIGQRKNPAAQFSATMSFGNSTPKKKSSLSYTYGGPGTTPKRTSCTTKVFTQTDTKNVEFLKNYINKRIELEQKREKERRLKEEKAKLEKSKQEREEEEERLTMSKKGSHKTLPLNSTSSINIRSFPRTMLLLEFVSDEPPVDR